MLPAPHHLHAHNHLLLPVLHLVLFRPIRRHTFAPAAFDPFGSAFRRYGSAAEDGTFLAHLSPSLFYPFKNIFPMKQKEDDDDFDDDDHFGFCDGCFFSLQFAFSDYGASSGTVIISVFSGDYGETMLFSYCLNCSIGIITSNIIIIIITTATAITA
ncbi:hypothetical protein niasHS_005375 [Heterodera schachtii]|uniref:Uncharacterized protein n=1 Tax=Heterodera schachtii TaxID=97005 RepID=A0ABD2J941_HETSC